MIVGIPCSGKTTRAKELEQFFKQQSKSVIVFSDDEILPDKNKAYKDSYNEKETRAKVKAAVERDIMKDMVVIADSTNYIKGYRYELYCASRSARTPHCVVRFISLLTTLFFYSCIVTHQRNWQHSGI